MSSTAYGGPSEARRLHQYGHPEEATPVIDYIRIRRLVDRETELRARARQIEIDPAHKPEADELFRLASSVREERLEYLRTCGLL